MEEQPDIIVDIGDSADMASLCTYDKFTKQAEGRRYVADLHAYHDSQRKLFREMNKHNNTMSKWKKKKYKPELIKCTGNHEHRILRASNESPEWSGHISMADLKQEHFGWDVHPFLTPAIREGIAFQHFFTSGVMGRPIGGIHQAAAMVKKNYVSCVAGHSHMRDFWEDTTPSGDRLFGLCVGCYFDYDPEFTSEADRYWRGVVILDDAHNGTAEPRFISLESIKRRFS
jgi:hypothetical protein